MSRIGGITALAHLEARKFGGPPPVRARRKRPFWKVLRPVLTAFSARV